MKKLIAREITYTGYVLDGPLKGHTITRDNCTFRCGRIPDEGIVVAEVEDMSLDQMPSVTYYLYANSSEDLDTGNAFWSCKKAKTLQRWPS